MQSLDFSADCVAGNRMAKQSRMASGKMFWPFEARGLLCLRKDTTTGAVIPGFAKGGQIERLTQNQRLD
jgi:hypothetical protein